MDSNHSAPAIVITVINDCASLWHEVLLGIEEEGIPFLLQHHPAGDIVDSAWQAARSSPLLVGIACDRHSLVVHYKNLPASAPLFTLMPHQDSQAQRNTGNNAARLVKGIPNNAARLVKGIQRDPFSGSPCLITGERQYE
ncbi:Propanediol dehydratase reactivation factor small subunit [Salmonella enterica subsp. enterica serovar Hvittingfoss str. A4-620]|nr:Propanediol dehydratase reactivation factor small subunit [Salmonella enterica subsp. enterica serovar Hvittingfoss str. A4-620]